MEKVTFSDGKYSLIWGDGQSLIALRYDEPWRDLCGDSMVLALAYEVIKLREQLGLDPETGTRLDVG